MSRIEYSIALLLLAVPAFVGCSSVDGAREPQGTLTSTTDPGQSSPLATYPPPRVGMDAALEGTLRLVDECVVVEGTDGYSDGDTLFAGGGAGPSQQQDAYLPSGCSGLRSFLVGA